MKIKTTDQHISEMRFSLFLFVILGPKWRCSLSLQDYHTNFSLRAFMFLRNISNGLSDTAAACGTSETLRLWADSKYGRRRAWCRYWGWSSAIINHGSYFATFPARFPAGGFSKHQPINASWYLSPESTIQLRGQIFLKNQIVEKFASFLRNPKLRRNIHKTLS
jgi:hypothetical protein